MGIINKWKQFFSSPIQEAKPKQLDNPNFKWSSNLFGLENSHLTHSEYIFSVVSRLSNTVSSLPLKLFQQYDEKRDVSTDKLFYSANVNQTMDQVINALEVSRDTNGNGYGLIERDTLGKPINIWSVKPDNVLPMMEEESHEVWYRITGVNEKSYFVHNMDMIHVKHISENGSLIGISPIKVLLNALDFDDAMRNFSLKEMQSIRDSFILSYAANVDSEKRQQVIDNFKSFYRENGGILFQEPGVEIKELERNFVAGDMKIADDLMLNRVANVYNIPAAFLNAQTGAAKNNEQLMQLFVNTTLQPIVKQYEREFNRKLLTQNQRVEGFYFKFNLNSLLRGDTQARQAFYHGAIRDGYMTPDDIRRLEDLTPKGGKSDELWISGDMYLMDDATNERNMKGKEQVDDKEVLANEDE